MSGERDRRRRDEGGDRDRDRDRRRRDEGGDKDKPRDKDKDRDRDRDRRRRGEGEGDGDRDRRKRDESERDRRRRDSEGAGKAEEHKHRDRARDAGGEKGAVGEGPRDRDRDRDRRRREEEEKRDDKAKRESVGGGEGERHKDRRGDKEGVDDKSAKKTDAGRAFGLTYSAYKAGRRVLEKHEKKCTYEQILEKGLNSSEFAAMIGKPGMPREEARALKEEARKSEQFQKKADHKEESRRIMRDFYRTVFEWAGQPVHPELRGTVDELEQRYKNEKKLEKEKAEEQARREKEAMQQEVEEAGPEPEEEEDDYGYEDDFEVADGKDDTARAQIKELQEAIEQENREADKRRRAEKRKAAASERDPGRSGGRPHSAAQLPARSHAEMARIAAKRKAWDRQYERANQLLRLVPLESVPIDLQGVDPLTEYDLYIRNFGSSNAKQASTQKPDQAEYEHTAVQTVRIHFSAAAANVPEDLGLAGRPKTITDTAGAQAGRLHIDSAKLSTFLANCTPVFRVLLDEAEIRMSRNAASGSSFSFSQAVTSLQHPLIQGRGTLAIAFSRVASHYLVTVHGPPTKDTPEDPSGAWAYDGLCLVWNINNPMAPDKVLSACGSLTTATFGAQRSHLLYAGSKDGTVYLWDLREPEYFHTNSIRSGGQHRGRGKHSVEALRMPSYATDALNQDNHTCAVRRILPVGYNSILGLGAGDAEASEQLATLDDVGNLNIWIVVDVHEAIGKRNFVSQTDFGLNIFSKVKLFKTATVHTVNPTRELPKAGPADEEAKGPPSGARPSTALRAKSPQSGSPRGGPRRRTRMEVASGLYALDLKDIEGLPLVMASDVEFQPDDAAQFLIATDSGFVNHGSRYGEGAVPANYRSVPPAPLCDSLHVARQCARPHDPRYGLRALAVHYSPVDSSLFLAAYADGSISVFRTGHPNPLVTLQDFTKFAVIQVRWSIQHKGVFWALDAAGFLFMFNLMDDNPEKRLKPVLTTDCKLSVDGAPACPNDVELSPDVREPKMAISYDKGRVDLHVIKDDLISHHGSGAWLDTL
eukprot:TRINITY_DN10446_c0_g1_i2.p1 TRINITY_DN10446_c0_g1~~TRINITY_DN10446_c0_g1_i2.p1  ORF type:complete len:1044 (+),score=283.87 TRINITY_DN10446_c0_g1_i2:135-3266(+)